MIKTDQPLVSIIIVNTHEEHYLIPLVESIQRIENELSFEIIIIDNDSKGLLKTFVTQDFPVINIVSIKENVGFCKANNEGLRRAKGKYILLLNPDTLLQQPSISKCIEYFEKHSEESIGAIGCRLQNLDGSSQKSFFNLAASINKTLLANAIYIKMLGQKIKTDAKRLDNELHQKTSFAPWLCGAFLLIKRDILIKEGFYLDEDFFLYSDDVELGYRIRSHGYKLIYLPDISIIHYGGGSRPFLKRFEQLTISEWLCIKKIHSSFYFFINQSLLLLNIMTDELLFCLAGLKNNITIRDRREKIIRHKIWLLWKRFTFRILLNYKKIPSSSPVMLKYQ